MFFGGSIIGGTSGIEQNFVGKKFSFEIGMGWHIADIMNRFGINVEQDKSLGALLQRFYERKMFSLLFLNILSICP